MLSGRAARWRSDRIVTLARFEAPGPESELVDARRSGTDRVSDATGRLSLS
jgi:hypothetical protein